jgi:hypothetical protein
MMDKAHKPIDSDYTYISDIDGSLQYSACHYSALATDTKTVINGKKEWTRDVMTFWYKCKLL